MMQRADIEATLPHREPFLLIDEIIELDPGKRAVALWHIREDMDFFRGHFPGYPVVPGVLIAESAAQTGAVALLTCDEHRGKLGFLTGIDNAKWRRQVKPGDTLTLTVDIENVRMGMGVGKALATVEGKTAFSGTIRFALGVRE